MCRSKNAGVAGYAEAFRPVQSDSQTSEWYSYFENDVLVYCIIHISHNDLPEFPSAVLSSIDDATASPHFSALQIENSFQIACGNRILACMSRDFGTFMPKYLAG